MHRCSSVFLLIITSLFTAALTGCLGKASPNPNTAGVKAVTLTPASTVSMQVGGTQIFSTTATDGSGHTVAGAVQYSVTVPPGTTNPAPLSVASNGNACAGAWDPSIAICSPGTPGVAIVTAVVNGVSSPPTTVYVHLHIDSLVVTPAQQIQPPYDCFSQGQTWLYQGSAYNNGVDITNTVGQFSWQSVNPGVLTAEPFIPTNQPNVLNEAQITADSPGITQIYATVAGIASNPVPITTCLVQYVRVRANGFSGNSITVNTGSAVGLEATAVDTLGFTLTKPPLTWSTTNPEVLSFSAITSTTGTNSATARANLGGADVSASCSPPTCNIGVAGYQDPQDPKHRVLTGMPVYASTGFLPNGLQGYGAIAVNVTSPSPLPASSGYAATDMCNNAPGCTSVLFEITPTQGGANPIGTTVSLPRTPNSMMFNYQNRIYLGSDQGLLYVDVGGASATATLVSNQTTPCNVTLCGKVLAISNDSKQVVVSDDISATPQVYIYNSSASANTSQVVDLILPHVVTAAAFSLDQSKVFLLTDVGTMYVYSTVDALAPVAIPASGTATAFSADGSFAYVAGAVGGGAGLVSAFSTCGMPGVPSTELGSPVTIHDAPVQIFPSPNLQLNSNSNFISQNVYVLEPPNIQVLNAQFTQVPIAVTPPLPGHSQLTCNPPDLSSFAASPTLYNLGQGVFTPIYARLAGDASSIIVVAKNVPAVLIFNIVSGTTTAVPLVNNAHPLSASASSDGNQLYVAACDQYPNNDSSQPCAAGSVHIVNTVSLGDFQQVPYINNSTNNMCNNLGGSSPLCVADLVAIRPQ